MYVISKSRNRKECGIGCGLALAKGVIKAHEGRIYVEDSIVGEGTRIAVELPNSEII
jgi:two-component system OmpR family sensor kinase